MTTYGNSALFEQCTTYTTLCGSLSNTSISGFSHPALVISSVIRPQTSNSQGADENLLSNRPFARTQ